MIRRISFTLKQFGWLKTKSKSENYSWRYKNPNLYLKNEIFRNLQLNFLFFGSYLCTNHYLNFSFTLLVILINIVDTRQIFRRFINLSLVVDTCFFFFEECKVLHALLGGPDFSKNWGNRWVPTYTTVVAYFSTTDQLFLIFKMLPAIILSRQNHPHVTILNQKIKY